jgi:hypothetical protein
VLLKIIFYRTEGKFGAHGYLISVVLFSSKLTPVIIGVTRIRYSSVFTVTVRGRTKGE